MVLVHALGWYLDSVGMYIPGMQSKSRWKLELVPSRNPISDGVKIHFSETSVAKNSLGEYVPGFLRPAYLGTYVCTYVPPKSTASNGQIAEAYFHPPEKRLVVIMQHLSIPGYTLRIPL